VSGGPGTTGIAGIHALAQIPGWLRCRSDIVPPTSVPEDFFGVNVAPADDPDVDNYIVERLQELGLRHVRLTLLESDDSAERLIQRLHTDGVEVLVCLVPTVEDAARMDTDTACRRRWGAFVADATERLPATEYEIGTTANRRRWSGFSHRSYAAAWQSAVEAVRGRDVRLAGPNVSDFEPLHNATFLALMRGSGRVPDVHTDNLFVERVVEPEAMDHRVAGRFLADTLGFNLVKKAAVLRKISTNFGIGRTYCTYNCWNVSRVARHAADPAAKQADYLVRYLVIAAASGALDRVYWGPLVGHLDGLIDDGSGTYPASERVARYTRIAGKSGPFRSGPAFDALRHTVGALRGTTCVRATRPRDPVHAYDFQQAGGGVVRAAWTRDGHRARIEDVFDDGFISRVRVVDRCGAPCTEAVQVLSEAPLFFTADDDSPFESPVRQSSADGDTIRNGYGAPEESAR
jgi:hypothetical protein